MRGTCRPRSSRHSASRSGGSTRSGWSRPRSGGMTSTRRTCERRLLTIGLDFVAPHRPRDAGSAGQTEARTRECLATMRAIGRSAPVHYQEPFRRGYGRWQPTASDFLTDLRGAVAGGAAGWCLHNGSSRGAPGGAPATLVRSPRPAPVRPARRGGTGGRRPGRGGDASGAASEGSRVPAPFRLARPALGPRPGGLRPHRPGGPGPRRRPRLRLRRPHPAARATLLVRVPRARRLGPA